jgi:hypothetical protein
MATFDAVSTTLTGADGAEQIVGASISPNSLSCSASNPVRGRSFLDGREQSSVSAGPDQSSLLASAIRGSNDAIGATLELDGLPCQIIGILPAGFPDREARCRRVGAAHRARRSVRGGERGSSLDDFDRP